MSPCVTEVNRQAVYVALGNCISQIMESCRERSREIVFLLGETRGETDADDKMRDRDGLGSDLAICQMVKRGLLSLSSFLQLTEKERGNTIIQPGCLVHLLSEEEEQLVLILGPRGDLTADVIEQLPRREIEDFVSKEMGVSFVLLSTDCPFYKKALEGKSVKAGQTVSYSWSATVLGVF